MTQRERSLFRTFLAIIAVGGVGLAVYSWVVAPLRDYKKQLEALENDVDTKERQVRSVQIDKKVLLEKWHALSLPAAGDRAANDYGLYLRGMLTGSGLSIDQYTPPTSLAPKAAPAGAQAKKPGHVTLHFTVHGKGTLAQIMKALESFQKTPVAHRVKSLTLDRMDTTPKDAKNTNPRLRYQLVAEAMIVSNANKKNESLASWETKLAKLPLDRDYGQVEKKNVFSGEIPYAPPQVAEVKEVPPGPDPREYVQLVSTTPTSNYAHMRNRLAGFAEIRVGTDKGFQFFRITDDNSKEVVKGKILKVDLRDVYFMVGEDPYAIHIGETLAYAMRRPLSDARLQEAGLLETFTEELRNLDKAKKAAGATDDAKKKASAKKL